MSVPATIHARLATAGLPVVSVRKNRDGTYAADLAADATDEQRAQAAQIIAAEATKIEANHAIDAQIAALEASKPGYVRGVREFMLGVSQILAQVPGAPDLSQTPGMRNVKTLDDQIAALRAQRR